MSLRRNVFVSATGFAVAVVAWKLNKGKVECNNPKKKVVVVGSGYAGRTFVKNIDTTKFEVILIDKNLQTEEKSYLFGLLNFRKLIFYPQPNYVDSISERRVVDQFMLLPKPIKEIKGECVNIDQEKSKVTLKTNEVLDYDYLVFATGSIPDTFQVQMNYDCLNHMWYFFKDKNDLDALMTVFDVVGLDDIVIMGGGITGVELASELSKRIIENTNAANKLIEKESEKREMKTITILEAGDRLLPKLKESTSSVLTKHLVDKQHVKIITSANVTAISGGKIKLVQNGDTEMELKSVVAVWTCGVKSDQLAINIMGHNKVHTHLQLPHATTPLPANAEQKIFAIGDCNNLMPKSAQNAKQQGAYLARYFNSGFEPSTPAFEFNSQGTMIRLSDRIYMDSPVYTGFLPLVVHHVIIWLDL